MTVKMERMGPIIPVPDDKFYDVQMIQHDSMCLCSIDLAVLSTAV